MTDEGQGEREGHGEGEKTQEGDDGGRCVCGAVIGEGQEKTRQRSRGETTADDRMING